MHGLNLEKTEAGTRPEHNPQPIWGLQVRGLNLKKTEAVTRLKKTKAGTRPERLSSTKMGVPGAYSRSAYPQPIWGFQVRGLNLKKTEARTRPERLSATETGVPGAWSGQG